MKKILCICLSLFVIGSIFAQGRKFERIGRFSNVVVLNITWKGIRIKHSNGSYYLQEKDITALSAADKKLLKEEIEVWKQKAAKHNKRTGVKAKNKAEQEKELDSLLSQLPDMKTKNICNWFQKRIGTTPYMKDFELKFFTAYGLAKNNHNVMNACKKRLESLDLDDFTALKEKCDGEPIVKINGIVKSKIGVPFSTQKGKHPDFTENLRRRYLWVPAKARNEFVKALNKQWEEESKCCFCKKEKPEAPNKYCSSCKLLLCSKCKSELVDKEDKDKKDKMCKKCQVDAEDAKKNEDSKKDGDSEEKEGGEKEGGEKEGGEKEGGEKEDDSDSGEPI